MDHKRKLSLRMRLEILGGVSRRINATCDDTFDFFLDHIDKDRKEFMDCLDGWISERRAV